MTLSAEDRRIRTLRPPHPRPDEPALGPEVPIGWLVERERRPGAPGGRESALTVFLAGAECPFTCVFCDLWRYTLPGRTAPGALPAQLRRAFDQAGPGPFDRIKLYNASNFFDPRAVPPGDLEVLATLLAPFSAVTVESHARTVGRRATEFAARLTGRLEVAIGLETIHPDALPRLNKQMTLEDFSRAAEFLGSAGIGLRAFVLLGAPFVPAAETVEWTRRSVAYALGRGARHVTIIPARGGNGEMERLASLGAFVPPTLARLEAALAVSLPLLGGFPDATVSADLWDADGLAGCESCRAARLERIRGMNRDAALLPFLSCVHCDGS